MMRLFLDANILFSAAYRDDSAASRLFTLQAVGRCHLLASPYSIEEARRNIAAKRPDRLAVFEPLTGQLQRVCEPSRKLLEAALAHGVPAKDAPILAAAIAAAVDVLITKV